MIDDSISIFWFFHPFNFCLCIRRQCLIICRLIFWFLFTLIASRQNKGRGNSISSLYCLSPFCSCAVGNPCALKTDLFYGLGVGCRGRWRLHWAGKAPLPSIPGEGALDWTISCVGLSAIFNRNISRYGIPSSQCNVLPQFWFPLFL